MVTATFLLASNIISELSKPAPNKKVLGLLTTNKSVSAIAAVSYFGMLHGVLSLPDGKRKERLAAYLAETVVPFYPFIPYDFNAAEAHAKITSSLESAGRPMPLIDSQIAAVALSRNLILVTQNVKDFAPVQEFFPLRIENWFA